MSESEQPPALPLSTIVVIGRTAFSPTAHTVTTILDNTPEPRRMVVIDGGSPRKVAQRLEALAREGDFTLIRHDAILAANEARNLAMPHVTTDFVAFVDNDVVVGHGWLGALEQCARETDASAVMPTMTWGRSGFDTVHFAGGRCHIVVTPNGRVLEDVNVHMHEPIATLALRRRERTTLLELHCVLLRTSVLSDLGPFDERMIAGREEVDLALALASRGRTAWLEPTVVVGYRSPGGLRLSDLPYHLARWSPQWADRSFRAFQTKWGLVVVGTDDRFERGHLVSRIGPKPGAGRDCGTSARRAAWRIRRCADLVATPIAVRAGDRKRRLAAPPRVVHTASWDAQ